MGDEENKVRVQWGKTEIALAKAAIGVLPFGSVFSELLTEFIPMQRKDRIDRYLHALGTKLDGMSHSEFQKKLENPEAVDLFEEGGFQSVRALTQERIEYISEAVATGIKGEDADAITAKRIIRLLSQIDDMQVIMLSSRTHENLFDDDFWNKHEDILRGPSTYLGSSRDEHEKSALHEAAQDELIRLGLLRRRFSLLSKNKAPEFDLNTGTIKHSSIETSLLGEVLLSHVGLYKHPHDDEAEEA